MQIVGIEHEIGEEEGVATIDVWYSAKRRAWIVERVDTQGIQLGAAYRCDNEASVAECVREWLRTHTEAYLLSPADLSAAEHRILANRPQKRAA